MTDHAGRAAPVRPRIDHSAVVRSARVGAESIIGMNATVMSGVVIELAEGHRSGHWAPPA